MAVAAEGIGAEVLLQVKGGEAYGEVYLEAEGAKIVLVAGLNQAGAVLNAQAEADLLRGVLDVAVGEAHNQGFATGKGVVFR